MAFCVWLLSQCFQGSPVDVVVCVGMVNIFYWVKHTLNSCNVSSLDILETGVVWTGRSVARRQCWQEAPPVVFRGEWD